MLPRTRGCPSQSRRQHLAVRSPFHLPQPSLFQSLLQNVEFCLTHCPLQSQQEPVVELPRMVDAVVVGNQRVAYGRQVKQMIPVSVVPRKARYFVADDDADPPHADFRHQSLESAPTCAVAA